MEGVPEAARNPVGKTDRFRFIGQVVDEDDELIAAQPGDGNRRRERIP